jgi:hypothetical protein
LAGSGVVCANFGKPRKTGIVCMGMWHAKCYRQDPKDPFPVLHANDLDDAVLRSEQLESDDPDRFRKARDGDHLMCPFQCDVCHFRNIQGRSPSEDHHDKLFMLCIRRANLDALWSREYCQAWA